MSKSNIVNDTEDGSYVLATVDSNPKPEDVELLLSATEEGRSTQQWVRLRDGTLLLAIFPLADIYEELTYSKNVCPFEYLEEGSK